MIGCASGCATRWVCTDIVLLLVWALAGSVALAESPATSPTTAPSTRPAMWPSGSRNMGPDVVILGELVHLYEPVPFDHKGHAQMAEMSTGCETCHHHTPAPTTRPAELPNGRPASHNQSESAEIPACKSCHAVDIRDADIAMPGLKGAYHRQCLNCHKEWTHANACSACHLPVKGEPTPDALASSSTRDDVLGRMHPPIPAPTNVAYKMRYTPVDGGNVLFRHDAHTDRYGLRCTSCHRDDTCSSCHDAANVTTRPNPRRARGTMTWAESHAPCSTCHESDRCASCHYHDNQEPPPVFSHERTGQGLDVDHASLACADCHTTIKTESAQPTCGDSSCHAHPAIAFPAYRPGPVVERPAAAPATRPTSRKATKIRPGAETP